MATMTAEIVRATPRTSRRPLVAWISAAGFLVSSAWFLLIETGVTQRAAPDFPSAPLDAAMMAHYAWFTTTLAQQRIVTGVAIGAFAAMIVAVWQIRGRLGAGASASAGALLMSLGAAIWIAGNVAQLGGHRAVGAMATNGNPLEVANAIAFTVDMIDDALEFAGFALLAVGVACFVGAARRTTGATRSWSAYTVAYALALLALAASHAMSNTDAANLLLVLTGAALTPTWLIWSDRVGRMQTQPTPEPSLP